MGTADKSCRLIEEAAGKGAELKPLLEAVAQTLDKENEGLRLAFGTDDVPETRKPGRKKDFLSFRVGRLFNSWGYIFISHLTVESQDFILRAVSIQVNASFLALFG